MPLAKNISDKITEQEYLEGELISDVRHEYIDGYVYAMAGASKNHGLISKNVLFGLEDGLRKQKSPCNIFSSDMKVRISKTSTNYFYPDVVVTCDLDDNDSEHYTNSPVIIVEVLSKSTRKKDQGKKRLTYFNIATLQEYVIIEQDLCEIEVFTKKNGVWQSDFYFLGDSITFKSINVTLSVEDIYYHVDNEDIVNYLKEKEKNDIQGED